MTDSDLRSFMEAHVDVQKMRLLDATMIAQLKLRKLYTGLVDIDINVGITFDSRVLLMGDGGSGKTTLLYRLIAAAQRTCRHCCTPIMAWMGDSGEFTTTCKCGKNAPMRVLLMRTEEIFDRVWAGLNGVVVNSLDIVSMINTEGIFALGADSFNNDVIDVLAIDSITAIAPVGRKEGTEAVGQDARMMSRGWQILADALTTRSATMKPAMLFFTTQWRVELSKGFGSGEFIAHGGKSSKFYPTEVLRMLKPRINEGINDPTSSVKPLDMPDKYVDFRFTLTKKKLGGRAGGSGGFRIFVDEYTTYAKSKRSETGFTVICDNVPGDTDENERIMALLKSVGAPLYIKQGSKYTVLGKKFVRVSDIAEYLRRPDVGYVCRMLAGAYKMSATSRPYLEVDDYAYGLGDGELKNLITATGAVIHSPGPKKKGVEKDDAGE